MAPFVGAQGQRRQFFDVGRRLALALALALCRTDFGDFGGKRINDAVIVKLRWSRARTAITLSPQLANDIAERIARILLKASKIVIVAGEGATASGAGPEILAVAEALSAPIATSLGANRS